MLQITQASRSQAKIKLGISGPSGSGKTQSSLLLAYGLIRAAKPTLSDAEVWNRICVIDTENHSGSLYVGASVGTTRIGSYLTIRLDPPFSAQRYLDAITLAEENGVEFLIIDSLSHAWSGEGGLLDVQAKASQRTGNSYTAWREVTPWHNKLVDKVLQCNMHVAITMRAKTEYVVEENEKGKKTPRKIGMAPVFRDGIEYETTIFYELSHDHTATASKDRTGLFDGQYFIIVPDTGRKIHDWLVSSAAAGQAPITMEPQASRAPETPPPKEQPSLAQAVDAAIQAHCEGMTAAEKQQVAEEIRVITGGIVNYRTVSDPDILQKLLEHYGRSPLWQTRNP